MALAHVDIAQAASFLIAKKKLRQPLGASQYFLPRSSSMRSLKYFSTV